MRSTKLAAVLFVEIAEFPVMLSKGEEEALAELLAWRDIARAELPEHGGELMDATGAELLLLFGSAVSAVQYALTLAIAVRSRVATLAPSRRYDIRSGIHLGEIWSEDGHVFGNGVNVAARVMQGRST